MAFPFGKNFLKSLYNVFKVIIILERRLLNLIEFHIIHVFFSGKAGVVSVLMTVILKECHK